MKAKLGRATYVGDIDAVERAEGDGRDRMAPPDPGACGVAAVLDMKG